MKKDGDKDWRCSMAAGTRICGNKMKTLSHLKLVGNVYLMLSSAQRALIRMAREVVLRPESFSF